MILTQEQLNKIELDLEKAKQLLREEVGSIEINRERGECAGCTFGHANRYLPATHPAWAHQPKHTCWSGRVQKFLKD